ncbi:MAG: RHS repeat-associated core domain-containing protein, partial [Chloroflexota bacterium]
FFESVSEVSGGGAPQARGFTGHEHIRQFNLINMNARLYDPQVGCFLSPDNYITDPENPQS